MTSEGGTTGGSSATSAAAGAASTRGDRGPGAGDDGGSLLPRSRSRPKRHHRRPRGCRHLALNLVVIDVNGGAPVEGAAVDVWHCDAEGLYSGFVDSSASANSGASDLSDSGTFLRGTQITDASGAATFATIYPGWYQGRTVHIHIKVRADGGDIHTASSSSTTLHRQGVQPYASRSGNRCSTPKTTSSRAAVICRPWWCPRRARATRRCSRWASPRDGARRAPDRSRTQQPLRETTRDYASSSIPWPSTRRPRSVSTVLSRRGRVPLSPRRRDAVCTGARHPRGRVDWPLTGILAQRAKDRPNRLGVTVCRVESVDGLTLACAASTRSTELPCST